MLLASLPLLVVYVGWHMAQPTLDSSQGSLDGSSDGTVSTDTELEETLNPIVPASDTLEDVISKPVLNDVSDYIFAVREFGVETPDRFYPIFSIYKKVDDQEPVQFATVGGANEYVNRNSFVLSPDERKLAVNLGSKLILIDIATGEIETLFTAKLPIGERVAFSPDGEKIAFIESNQYTDGSQPCTLYTLDLQTRELETLTQLEVFNCGHVEGWQSNDHLVLSGTAAKGCALPWYGLLNIATNEIVEETSLYEGGSYYGDIKIQSLDPIFPTHCEENAQREHCFDQGYTYYQKRNFSNSTDGAELGVIGEIGKFISSHIVSPDVSAVLFDMYDLPTESLQCDQPTFLGYYLMDFTTGDITTVDSLGDQLATWGFVLTDDADIRIFITPVYRVDTHCIGCPRVR